MPAKLLLAPQFFRPSDEQGGGLDVGGLCLGKKCAFLKEG